MELKKSNKPDKKYMVTFINPKSKREKVVHFGQNSARDFSLINSKNSKFYLANKEDREKVKSNYRSRHRNDNINDPYSAGSLSWWLLWNKPTLSASIKDYEKKFNINIIKKF
tara:strand:- start:86 stop:421 length:336 start_codon:yes stop_codon:yes gene_type:complete